MAKNPSQFQRFIGSHIAQYVSDKMAMRETSDYQEENWIAGHMVTFAAECVRRALRAERKGRKPHAHR